MADYIVAIDQGTTSTRAIVFDHSGSIVSTGQQEHEQIFPRAGWVEHDPERDLGQHPRGHRPGAVPRRHHPPRHRGRRHHQPARDRRRLGQDHRQARLQRDRLAGHPHAVDRRPLADGGVDRFKAIVGLPLATYFAGTKIVWILENVEGAREKAEAGDLLFGTTDTWVLWNLTGGTDGGVHVTDVTNASRTLFMDLETLQWHDDILADFGVPKSMLPEIISSSEVYGHVESSSLLREVPIAGILGDQQAATFGQAAFDQGESKNTYGTGNFLIFNTGTEIVHSENGLLTTLGYKLGDGETALRARGLDRRHRLAHPVAARQPRPHLGSAPEVEALAKTVEDNGGVYFVPAFSGLFAPYWRPDARGALVGLTRYVNKGHIARAALEATAFQTREVLDAVNADSGVDLTELKVDGGMIANDALMQFQADILDVPVVRPVVAETTALGAAYAAGLAVGFWANLDDLRANWQEDKRWEPQHRRRRARPPAAASGRRPSRRPSTGSTRTSSRRQLRDAPDERPGPSGTGPRP